MIPVFNGGVMRVIVGCEFSQVVTKAFRERGHEAYSCDLLPAEGGHPEWHFQVDILELCERMEFALGIFHPPCTAICVSGNRHYAGTQARQDGVEFVRKIWALPIKKMCIENPVGVINTMLPEMPKPQYIQPWQFGHGETKKTGLWLRGLPHLEPTNIVEGREHRIWKMPPSEDRWKLRAKTYTGIAEAMAKQWG